MKALSLIPDPTFAGINTQPHEPGAYTNPFRDITTAPPLPKTLCPNPQWVKRHPGDLVERTMVALRQTFKERNHHPSEAQFASLEMNASVIQAMADGSSLLQRHFYLSSLAPGIGKTTLDVEAVRQLIAMPEYRGAGVLFLIARCEEIRTVAQSMGLNDAEYAVLVTESSDDCKGIFRQGNPTPGDARVLFTTQAMLSSRLAHGERFEALDSFWFRGKPRRIRIWDEAILPSRIITVGLYQIKHLSKDLSKAGFINILETLDKFEDALKGAKDQDVVQVPDLAALDAGLEDLRGAFDSADDKRTIENLWELSGCCVRVRPDHANNVIVTYADLFPSDLGPMLVQDASGGLRKTYDLWRKDRGGLCPLPSAPKCYGGLTIHHWDRGAGRDKFKPNNKQGDEIISGVVATIEGIPKTEPVLVVHYQEGKYIRDIAGEIQAQLGARANVEFIHWGIHTATNKYQDVKHVFLIGAYQYNVPVNEAYGRSAKGLSSSDLLSPQEYDQVRLGEIQHNIYQAACRGNVRKSEGAGCPPGNHLYMIFSTHKKAGMPRAVLQRVFPGASVMDWKPVEVPLSSKAEKLLAILNADKSATTFRKADLKARLGITDPTLRSLVTKIEPHMAQLGRPLTVRPREVYVPRSFHPVKVKGNPI